jgi:sentrin-specific protease 1
MHWCLAVVFIKEQRIQYMDSMAGTGVEAAVCLENLLRWLKDEKRDKKGEELDDSQWNLVGSANGIPQQKNG